MEPKNNEAVNPVSDHVKAMALIHLVGMLLGGWGVFGVLIYWLIYNEKMASSDTKVFYNIMNFSISFLIYFAISGVLCLVLIGFLGLIFFGITYFILVIISSIKYLQGKEYTFPMTIEIIK